MPATGKKNTLLNLKTHYQKIINEQLNDLFKIPGKNWKFPLKIATKWIRTNLGKRLSQETISQVEKLLSATAENAEWNALHSAEIYTPTRRRQPAPHSPGIESPPQPPEMNKGNPSKMEKLIFERTSALELFRERIRQGGERWIEPATIERTTQTQMDIRNTDERVTQTETKVITTHHRTTQTETTKRLAKGVGLQVQPQSLDRSAKDTQTVLTMLRKNWDRMHEKILQHQTEKGL